MTTSLRRGRVIVAAALVLLLLVWLPLVPLAVGQVLVRPSFESLVQLIPLIVFPFYAMSTWRGYPSVQSARWTLVVAYGLLALLFVTLSVLILVNMGPFGRNPIPGVGLALMETMFALPAVLFAAVLYLLVFSPSVREFWRHRLEARQGPVS